MRRPTPQRTRQILAALVARTQTETDFPALVKAIQNETGCSRATGYRAVQDAISAGAISVGNPETDTE